MYKDDGNSTIGKGKKKGQWSHQAKMFLILWGFTPSCNNPFKFMFFGDKFIEKRDGLWAETTGSTVFVNII